MDTIYILLDKFMSSVGPFFLLLGLLIFVHELGHFLVAKFFGVRVETFSLGFGKKLLQYKKGDTVYCISAIPLGGYVKMFGDDPTKELPEEEKAYSFLHKPVLPRIAIVLAGPLMNLFFAVVLFAAIGLNGEPVPGTQLGDIAAESAAFQAGFRSGDTIISVDNNKVSQWRDFKAYVEDRPNESLNFQIQREATKETLSIDAETTQIDNPFIFSTNRKIGWIDGLRTDSRASLVAISDVNGSAAQAGIKNLDIITAINGNKISYWRQIEPALAKAIGSSDTLKLTVVNQTDPKEVKREITLPAPKEAELSALGLSSTELLLYSIKPDSPADKSGLKAGDRLVEINAQPIKEWDELLQIVKNWSVKNPDMSVTYQRGRELKTIKLSPEMTEIPTPQGQFEQRFAIGISPALMSVSNEVVIDKVSGIGPAVALGFEKSWDWSKLIAISMLRLVQNEVSARNIGGVISIGRVASQSYELGWLAFVKMMAIISINLFLLNLLPVPVLDGGHLLFFSIEAIKGSPISLKKMEIAQQVGLVLLLSLMVFALFNDIRNLLTAW